MGTNLRSSRRIETGFLPPDESEFTQNALIARRNSAILTLVDPNAAFLRTVLGIAPHHLPVYTRGKSETAILSGKFVEL